MEKLLETKTTVIYDTTNEEIHIKVEYDGSAQDELPNTLSGQITDVTGIVGVVGYQESELLLTVKNSPEQINYQLSGDDLILFCTTGDGLKYSIDENGDLLYEKEI